MITTQIQLACTLLLTIALSSAFSFDWEAKPNSALRADMLNYVQNAAKTCKSKKTKAMLDKFIKNQSARSAGANEYTWMDDTRQLAYDILNAYPPGAGHVEARKLAFRILDFPLHVDSFSKSAPVAEKRAYAEMATTYIRDNKDKVLRELKSKQVSKGVVIWKLYNMGYVIRTANHTIAMDITDRPNLAMPAKAKKNGRSCGKAVELWSDKDYSDLVRQIDILFVTHLHGDHYSRKLINQMLAAKKPVVLPAEIMSFSFKTRKRAPALPASKHKLLLTKSNSEPLDIGDVKVWNFMGNQGKNTPCNLYLVELDGIRVVHNGDNYDRSQEAKLAKCRPADIIIASCWNDMPSLVRNAAKAKGFSHKKALLIPSHENELNHSVGHRESYRELFTRRDRLACTYVTYPKTVVLSCGESVRFPLPTKRSRLSKR